MATVYLEPLNDSLRAIPAHWRPSSPPLFVDGAPTRDDVEIAVALLKDLAVSDRESYLWHGSDALLARLRARLDA